MIGGITMKRFEIKEKQGSGLAMSTRIVVDRETGVQYLFAYQGYAGGITLLVDKDGKPLLDTTTNLMN